MAAVNRGQKGMSSHPRGLAILALEALARYKMLVQPGEKHHEKLARRLAAVAVSNSWESEA